VQSSLVRCMQKAKVGHLSHVIGIPPRTDIRDNNIYRDARDIPDLPYIWDVRDVWDTIYKDN
jgi:hypothetical protein